MLFQVFLNGTKAVFIRRAQLGQDNGGCRIMHGIYNSFFNKDDSYVSVMILAP
jgi:hypothetical protein